MFLSKIVPGGADRSYGIHVAKLAGLPSSVITRAQEVSGAIGATGYHHPEHAKPQRQTHSHATLPQPHPLIDEVRQIDLFSMTPLDALNRLADLQKRAADSPARRFTDKEKGGSSFGATAFFIRDCRIS